MSEPKLTINYSPALIDEAIKEHLAKHLDIKGEIEIEYMHRRKTKKVSAAVFVNSDQTINASSTIEVKGLPDIAVIAENTKEALEAITFEDLPLHEQQEATGHVETDELEDIVEHMQEEETEDMESLFE